jgi:hypothetical protein
LWKFLLPVTQDVWFYTTQVAHFPDSKVALTGNWR